MKNEKEKIKELIDLKKTNKEIASILEMSLGTLRRRIKDYELNRFSQKERILNDVDRGKIIDLYNSGLTCLEISNSLSIYRITISRHLKEAGFLVKKRPNENQRKEYEKIKKCEICEKEFKKRTKICMTCYTNTRRYKIKSKMIEYKGGKCQKCDEGELDISCYDFHHLDPTKKEFNLSALNSAKINWGKVKEELDKCLLLCSNCHRSEHSNYKNKKFLSYVNKLDKNFFE